VAVGHRLAQNHELRIADILDQPFPGAPSLHPEWRAFWTLDAQRPGPPPFTDDRVETAGEGLRVVASGRAIATIPAAIAGGLPHPGVIAIPLSDGPPVATRLVWHSDDETRSVHSLIELATAMTPEPASRWASGRAGYGPSSAERGGRVAAPADGLSDRSRTPTGRRSRPTCTPRRR
jgi:hypothetical protein